MHSVSAQPQKGERVSTGIGGLDEILGGGLPANRFYLLRGEPGSGKTTLALQFLLEGVKRGEKGLYITLTETKAELLGVTDSHGWSLDGIDAFEMSAVEDLLKIEAQTTVFHASEVELNSVTRMLLEAAERGQPRRAVFESAADMRLLSETPLRYRRQLLSVKQFFAKRNCTVLLLDDRVEGEIDSQIQSLVHGVFELQQLPREYGVSRRRLRVTKVRGIKYREGWHDYVIQTGGLQVFPRLLPGPHGDHVSAEKVGSGSAELDSLLGGGLDRGTTTLVMGPAGAGKSSLAQSFVHQALKRGEKALVFTFDETRGILLARGRALGMNFDPYIADGLVDVRQVDPAELSPGEFTSALKDSVAQGTRIVVVDSLNGYLNAMPGDQYLNLQLHEVCAYLNERGVVTILLMAVHGLLDAAQVPVDISYLADTVVTVRYFEAEGAVKQAIAVVKKRSGTHEHTIREFSLVPGGGICVGEVLREFQGVLTGTPRYTGDLKRITQ